MQCTVYQLGLIEYSKAYQLQTELVRRRLDSDVPNTLLLLEHPPTITIGRFGKPENILASRTQLEEEGVSLVFTDRGGDVTYHGPGQIIGYPVIDLHKSRITIRRYIYKLEEVIINTLRELSLTAYRDATHRGVWIKNEEIAAIGLRISRGITMHGFALNVNPDMTHFSLINPCGFTDRKAASIASILSRKITMEEVTERLIAQFSNVFDAEVIPGYDIFMRSGR